MGEGNEVTLGQTGSGLEALKGAGEMTSVDTLGNSRKSVL